MIIKEKKRECRTCGYLYKGGVYHKCFCGDCPALLYEMNTGIPWEPK